MNEFKLKEFICEIGRRVYNKGFAAANDGNITIRLNDHEVLCTPTMVSKGFLKPEDICKVDMDGKQLAGTKKRTSEVLLHLAVYKARPDIKAVVHCHPPHATAFAVAREPIPKCILPEVEVFLGEVPMAEYATPGNQGFADTVLPYVKDCNTIILANHGTVSFGPDLEKAYFNTEIIDAYCKILLLARQLGRINYFTEKETRELLDLKKRIGYDDPRFRMDNCDLCGNSVFERGYSEFVPMPLAFQRNNCSGTSCLVNDGVLQDTAASNGRSPAAVNGTPGKSVDLETIIQTITDQVMAQLEKAAV
jgi:L-fuculose-phosphate aldolase